MMLYRCFWNVFRGQGSQPAIQEEEEEENEEEKPPWQQARVFRDNQYDSQTHRQAGCPSLYTSSSLLLLSLGKLLFFLLLLPFCLHSSRKQKNKNKKKRKKTTLGAKKQVSLFTYSLQVWACVCV